MLPGVVAARKGSEMKRSAFGPDARVCPLCEMGELHHYGSLARCDSCGRAVEGDVLKTMEQIASLPDVLGKHACECGHPEMRRLPDGVFHCPACGSEVIPPKRPPILRNSQATVNGGVREAA
jgi:ribosomal protein L37AE/L43A